MGDAIQVAKKTRQRGAEIDPETRSWIDNCIVPILVREFLNDYDRGKDLATQTGSASECEPSNMSSAKSIE